ncbi:hypothetical protein IOLA_046 [uncultured bacterium]|nr:hypothetical protein IOLA_046 [uncultured bacterium]
MLSSNGMYDENINNKLYSKYKINLQSKNGLISSTDLISRDLSKIYKNNKYFNEIYETDDQITHDNHTSVSERLKTSLLSAATVLVNRNKYKFIKNDKDKIMEFPGIIQAIISQMNAGITKNTLLSNRIFNRLFKHIGNKLGFFGSKTKLELRIRTVILLCDLAEKLHYHIAHTGSHEQLMAYENSLFFRIFITPKVSSIFLGSDEDVIKSNICNALDTDLCACLLSMLDKSNFHNYLKGIQLELRSYLSNVCSISYDDKISMFLNEQHKYFNHNIDANNKFSDFEKLCAGFGLVLWMVISGLSESVISSSNFKPMSLELTRKLASNLLYERNKYIFDTVSTKNHILSDMRINKNNLKAISNTNVNKIENK